ncbi:hypothetical protein NX059_000856 [Plenodomus lindquistii]|nr:hypothetical protein NX059_000856 [Plenodomus lindquistii]
MPLASDLFLLHPGASLDTDCCGERKPVVQSLESIGCGKDLAATNVHHVGQAVSLRDETNATKSNTSAKKKKRPMFTLGDSSDEDDSDSDGCEMGLTSTATVQTIHEPDLPSSPPKGYRSMESVLSLGSLDNYGSRLSIDSRGSRRGRRKWRRTSTTADISSRFLSKTSLTSYSSSTPPTASQTVGASSANVGQCENN